MYKVISSKCRAGKCLSRKVEKRIEKQDGNFCHHCFVNDNRVTEKQCRKLSCLIDNWGRSFELLSWSWMGWKERTNIFHSSLSCITKRFSRDPETKTYKRRRETFEYMFYWISKFVSWKMMLKLGPNFLLASHLGNLEELFAFNLIRVALDWNWQGCHSHFSPAQIVDQVVENLILEVTVIFFFWIVNNLMFGSGA